MNYQALITHLRADLMVFQNEEKIIAMENYMKNHFSFLGITAQPRNTVQKVHFSDWKINLSLEEKWQLIFFLFQEKEREFQYIAIDFLNRFPSKDIYESDIDRIEQLIQHKSWWDSVDNIASNFLGKYAVKFPIQMRERIKKWMESENLWLQRSCLIFQLKFGIKTDFSLLTSLILELKYHQNFFIQKAIGWSLRQFAKFEPEKVKEFVLRNEISGLAYREALKNIQ